MHHLDAGPPPQDIETVLADTTANARAVVSASAAMGGGPEQVLLFEPPQAVGMVVDGGRATEMQVETIIARGFARFLPEPRRAPTMAPHWRLTHRADHVDLWEDDGLWASSPLRLNDEWLAAATEHGRVRVIYGTGIGVRVPPGHSKQQYNDHDRDTELAANRRRGITATAVIPWT